MKRILPRPFSFHFGKGMVIDEVSIHTPYHEPTIQLLQFDSGEKTLRFCVYHGKTFSRVPLLIDVKDWKKLLTAARQSPEIKKYLLLLS